MRVVVYVYTRDVRVKTRVPIFPISTVSVQDRFWYSITDVFNEFLLQKAHSSKRKLTLKLPAE